VAFRSAASILAVCEYCRTTLLERDGAIENLGRMATLAEDRSPLRLGSEGRWKERHFTVVGRLQLKYEHGLWSEWFLLFDDQRTGWLSEAAGEYALFFPMAAAAPLPAFADLSPGDELRLETRNNDKWVVADIERAECVAGEGELPFRVGSGYPAPVADLRAGRRLATLDYSEGEDKPPLVFIGQTVDFASLAWANLREEAAVPVPSFKARALRCAHCGAPLEVRHADILAIGCARCGAVTDAESEKLLSALKSARRVKPLIPPGAAGAFRGEKLEVIGFMQRFMTAGGVRYDWREYLLARVEKPGYRWLTEYDGHWNAVDVLGESVRTPGGFGLQNDIAYRGANFRHFQTYEASVDFVIGEFTWRVTAGEKALLADYVAPPRMLSGERTKKEISWSLGEYVEPREIAQAFGLAESALPQPKGVYANQPSPWIAPNRFAWKTALFAILAALVVQFALFFGRPPDEFARGSFKPSAGEIRVTEAFTLDRPATLRVVGESRGLENNWIELGLWLVNERGGEARAGTVELSRYTGWDAEDGRWVEDNQRRALVFRDVPAGDWRVMVEQSLDPSALRSPASAGFRLPVSVSLRVDRAPPPWSNLFVFLFVILLWPLYTFLRMSMFETRRWAESDHAGGDYDEDDGDDDD
jgi:hypothetical protein